MNKMFRQGQAAMQIQWDAFATQVEEAPDTQVRGKVGYALVPGQPNPAPVIGGWVLVINKNSKKAPLAWDFIKWCCGPEFGRTLNQEGGQLPRLSLYTDPELIAQHPWYDIARQSLEKAQQRTSFTPGGPTLPSQTQYESILGGEANAAFTVQKSPEEAVNDAADKLGKMLEAIGRR